RRLLGDGGVMVLAEQVLEDAGRSEKTVACPTFRAGELGPVASPLQHEPELVDRLAVRMLAGPVDGLDHLAELFTSKPLQRNSLDSLGQPWRAPKPGKHDSIIVAVQNLGPTTPPPVTPPL